VRFFLFFATVLMFVLAVAVAIASIPMKAHAAGLPSGLTLAPVLVEPEEGVPSSYMAKLIFGPPAQYLAEINSGWPRELYGDLLSKLRPGASYVVIHNRLPWLPIDLRSPQNFKLSLLSGKIADIKAMDLGHVQIGWHCSLQSGTREGVTGFTGELNGQALGMELAGWGFGALFSIYDDGHLQTPVMVKNVMAAKSDHQFATLAVEVSAADCDAISSFVAAYVNRADKPYMHFSLNADPGKFEGAGCGSFAVTAASRAPVFGAMFGKFWRRLSVNTDLLGYGITKVLPYVSPYEVPHDRGDRHVVNAAEIFGEDWNKNPGPSLRVMDPELFYLFQATVFQGALPALTRDDPAGAARLHASPFVRYRSVLPTVFRRPGERGAGSRPVLIDAAFDPHARDVIDAANSWLEGLEREGFTPREFELNGQPALLLAR
jgi:hypothetical protein